MGPATLLVPPVAFVVILCTVVLLAAALKPLAFSTRTNGTGREPYACGEDIPVRGVQPNYVQFFPFAFFFTIMHVVALMVATVPAETASTLPVVAVYMVGGGVGLLALQAR